MVKAGLDFNENIWLDIRDELKSIDNEVFPDSCPDELVHYTTPDGFKGIIATHEMWCTDLRHVTDKCECNYGMDVIKSVILKKCVPPQFKEAIRHENTLFGAKERFRGFIACYCSSRDESPYMWKNYAAGGTGHAIVFDGKALYAGAQEGKAYALFPVVYDEHIQVEKTTQVIDRAIQLQSKWAFSGETLKRFWSQEVEFALMLCGLRFKKPSLKDEQEIRQLVWLTDGVELTDFKGKTHIAMPFESSAINRTIRGPNSGRK
jgi:hypothetical protein